MREHRCTAVRPPAPLADEIQRTLCLVEAHLTCADYLAARQRRAAELAKDRIAQEQLGSLRFQPAVRSIPLALERPVGRSGRIGGPGAGGRGGPHRAQVSTALIGLVALVALVALGASTLLGGIAGRSPSPRPVAGSSGSRASIAVASQPRATASPSASVPASTFVPSASAGPSPTVRPTPRSYRVKRGDSLTRIAKQFDTTVAAIKVLNGIPDPPRIRIGQVLAIPPP